MTLTVRSSSVTGATTASRSLTHAEMDANWAHFVSRDAEIQASLAASTGAALVGFVQSGSGTVATTVSERLQHAKHLLDWLPLNKRSAVIAGTNTDDLTEYVQSAFDSGYVIDPLGFTYLFNNVTVTGNLRRIMSSNGIARFQKNANGPLITFSGDDVVLHGIDCRGVSASYTSDNIVITGDRPTLSLCSSRDTPGRALKATGQRVVILGSGGSIWETVDSTSSGYDIEIGVSGTATLYHHLQDIYTSQADGGILATDTGSMTILGGQFGKLKIARGTSPAGVNGGKIIGARILGAVDINESDAVISANQFGAVAITFGASTSGIIFDISNLVQSGATITNNGNQNNLIIREVSSGSTNQIKFGDDGDFGVMTITPTSPGRFEFPQVIIPNNSNYYAKSSTGTDIRIAGVTSGNLVFRENSVSNGEIHDLLTGTSGAYKTRFENGAATAVRIATTTVNCTAAAASVTASNLIPKGARVLGVTTTVTVALGTSNGTTGYQVGDGSDVDRWADKTGTATSTSTDNSDATADWEGSFTSANNVVITAKGGNFDGTGTIRITVLYRNTTALTG
jgi:hypothetical protein